MNKESFIIIGLIITIFLTAYGVAFFKNDISTTTFVSTTLLEQN